jgi:phosphoadenosine phosphosulfate reductase
MMQLERLTISTDNLSALNAELNQHTPREIIEWVLEIAEKPIVTTNFRPYEAAILHACAQGKPDIPVVWCDTGYNTPNTYNHAERIIGKLNLNIDLYVPKQSTAWRDANLGIPSIEDAAHAEFTHQVKLEPFQRAMDHHKPDVWFTNLRKGQTELRDSLDILSFGKNGVLKVSPFYYYTDQMLDTYLAKNELENEFNYFDPTKALDNRECGLHLPA